MKQRSFFLSLLGSLLLSLFAFRDGFCGDSLLAPLDVLSNPAFTPLQIAKHAPYPVLRHRPTYLGPSLAVSIYPMLLVGGALVARLGLRHQTPETLGRG